VDMPKRFAKRFAQQLSAYFLIIFTPAVDLKDELKNTAIQIICIDRNGEEARRVTSADDGTVEDPDNGTTTGDDNQGGGSTDPNE